jgi:hypothetical protein
MEDDRDWLTSSSHALLLRQTPLTRDLVHGQESRLAWLVVLMTHHAH